MIRFEHQVEAGRDHYHPVDRQSDEDFSVAGLLIQAWGEPAILSAGEAKMNRQRHPLRAAGAGKGCDVAKFATTLRTCNVTPHIAVNRQVSQRTRKRIEEIFGWQKSLAGTRQTRFRGLDRAGWAFTLTAAAYNLAQRPKLIAVPA